uniref:Uncharacterized protein n=1 Tax=Arundo donax TaxID=35708 RepID=A0A0A9FJE0_ARUDO
MLHSREVSTSVASNAPTCQFSPRPSPLEALLTQPQPDPCLVCIERPSTSIAAQELRSSALQEASTGNPIASRGHG